MGVKPKPGGRMGSGRSENSLENLEEKAALK